MMHPGVVISGLMLLLTVAWNGTVTRSSDEPWNHHTEAIPTQKPWLTTTKEFIIGISITVLVLLILVSAVAVAKY
uniref:Uncharacterized protein n=1 Tax=Nannospalax galili TaxID=1026970 RepID=A0A8C6QBH4_NANGA